MHETLKSIATSYKVARTTNLAVTLYQIREEGIDFLFAIAQNLSKIQHNF